MTAVQAQPVPAALTAAAAADLAAVRVAVLPRAWPVRWWAAIVTWWHTPMSDEARRIRHEWGV